jgi:hypothetical protein
VGYIHSSLGHLQRKPVNFLPHLWKRGNQSADTDAGSRLPTLPAYVSDTFLTKSDEIHANMAGFHINMLDFIQTGRKRLYFGHILTKKIKLCACTDARSSTPTTRIHYTSLRPAAANPFVFPMSSSPLTGQPGAPEVYSSPYLSYVQLCRSSEWQSECFSRKGRGAPPLPWSPGRGR